MRQYELKYKGSINISKDTLFVFFDTETVEDSEGRLNISLLSYIAYHYNTDVIVERATLVNREYAEPEVFDGDVEIFENEEGIIERFTSYLIEMTTFFRNVIVVSHNLHFDRIAINFDKIFDTFSLRYYNLERTMFLHFSRTFRSYVRSLIFNDNMNYYPMSLRKIGEAFGLEKMEVESYDRVTKEVIEYNIRDVEILMKSHLYVVKRVVEELGMEKYYLTVSSIAYALLLNKYLPPDVRMYTHHVPEIEELERAAYKGGRNENRVMGVVRQRIYRLDVNSQYPYQMLTKRLPLFISTYYDFVSGKKYTTMVNVRNESVSLVEVPFDNEDPIEVLIRLLESDALFIVEGIFDVNGDVVGARGIVSEEEVNTDSETLESDACVLDPYVKYSGTTLLFAKFTDVPMAITSEELRAFRDKITVKKIHRIAVYYSGYPTRKFVARFYGQRILAKETGNGALDLFNKLIMNTLSGKFAQRVRVKIPAEEAYDEILKGVGDAPATVYDLSLGMRVENVFGHYFLVDTEEVLSRKSFTAVSAFITAYGRIYLTQLIDLVEKNGGTVFYYDTDSLHVDERGYQILLEHGFIARRHEIGKLKVEGVYDAGIYITNKQYVLLKDYDDEHYEVDIVFSGVPLKNILQMLHDKGLIKNTIGVTDYVSHFITHRSFDFPVLVEKEKIDDIFLSLLNYDVDIDQLTKTKAALRKFGRNVVRVEKIHFKRRGLKFKRRYRKVGHLYWVSEPYEISGTCENVDVIQLIRI